MQTGAVRQAVDQYLRHRLSRRGFIARLAGCGFSVAGATSILESLAALLAPDAAAATEGAHPDAVLVEGTGGALLVEQLRAAGVKFVFNCNSSGTYAVFDALLERPEMQVIQVSQEGQMVSVAEGYALASGETAFTLNDSVGLPNTLNNMYNAWRDETPMVVAAERQALELQGGRDAVQEWDDYLGPTASFTRWRWSVDRAERIPEIVRRAFRSATTPPQGPVALAFPSDVLSARGVKGSIVGRERFLRKPRVRADARLIEECARLLFDAATPVILLGPEVSRSDAVRDVVRLAEQLGIAVTQSDDLFADFPTSHPLFFGTYRRANVDFVLNIGARMPAEAGMIPLNARIAHMSVDPGIVGRVVPTDVSIVADVKESVIDLIAAIDAVAPRARREKIQSARLEAARRYAEKERARRAARVERKWHRSPMTSARVLGELNRRLDKDAVIVSEVTDEHRLIGDFDFGPEARTKIGRTAGQALGWGIGAAMGVKLAWPNRQVVALQGDGGFLFGQAETLWTMVRYEAPVIIVILNNRSYDGPRNKILKAGGRQAQAGREMTCYLGDPDVDFAKVAAGFGVRAEVVTQPEQIGAAIQRAIENTRAGRPYLIDAVVGRSGPHADSTWHPKYSIAAARTRKV